MPDDRTPSTLDDDIAYFRAVAHWLLEAEKALFDIATSLCKTQADMDRLAAWAEQLCAADGEKDNPMKTSLFVLALVSIASAADYYVAASGNDANTGLSGHPWKTIGKVNATRFKPGDSIRFNGGDTFPGNLYFGPGTGGTASAPITLTSYGTGKATISAGNAGNGIKLYNTAGMDITNLIVVGAAGPGTKVQGVDAYNYSAGMLPRLHIDAVEVYGFRAYSTCQGCGGEGISIGGDGTNGFSAR